jgi:glycosyltransferase involved in cell wall biosynthesis
MKIILFHSGVPVPAMADIGRLAVASGREVRMIFIDSQANDLPLDPAMAVFPVKRLVSPFRGFALRRFLYFPKLVFGAFRELSSTANDGDIVITCGIDTLVIARFFDFYRKIRIRHQVRDLHPILLGDSAAARLIALIERWLLRRCETIMFSAPGFYEEYYSKIYKGQALLLENLPRRDIWSDYTGPKDPGLAVTVGYIGIARYLEPLVNLVDAIRRLNDVGGAFRAKFVGGGAMDVVKARAAGDVCFEFSGLFHYSNDIGRLHNGVDVIFAVYDGNNANCQVAMPTKFYESLITGIPIMVAEGTHIGRLVESLGVGVAVDGKDIDAIAARLEEIQHAGSWHDNARKRLSAIRLDDYYERFHRALSSVINYE